MLALIPGYNIKYKDYFIFLNSLVECTTNKSNWKGGDETHNFIVFLLDVLTIF